MTKPEKTTLKIMEKMEIIEEHESGLSTRKFLKNLKQRKLK